jgi:hypothetical protein
MTAWRRSRNGIEHMERETRVENEIEYTYAWCGVYIGNLKPSDGTTKPCGNCVRCSGAEEE